MLRAFINKFSVFDLIIISLIAAIGMAIKPFASALAHIITGPMFIPAGALAGGIYMLFLVLAFCLTGKMGSALLVGLIQAIIAMVAASFGSHGIMSIITYMLPGLAVELVMLISGHRGECVLCCFFACMAANVTGSLLVNFVFFNLPLVPLFLCLSLASLSGGLGGALCWKIASKLYSYGIIDAPQTKNSIGVVECEN